MVNLYLKKCIPKTLDALLSDWGTWTGGRMEVCDPIVPIDLQIECEWNWFSEVDNAGIFHSPDAKPSRGRGAGLIWSIWTGCGLRPLPIVLCQMGLPIHHDPVAVWPLWYLHCHWCDTPAQWWIADSMHYDKIERSASSAPRPATSAQLGTRHSWKASLFNVLTAARGPCGQQPATCIINVASLTIFKSPVTVWRETNQKGKESRS